MELSALVLLDDNPDAIKLVATWPVVGRRATVVLEDEAVKISEDDATFWAAVSGVDEEDLQRILPLLFCNGIVTTDGEVDPNALRYVNAKVASKLPKGAR